MKPLRKAIIAAVVLPLTVLTASPARNAGSTYFDDANRSLIASEPAKAAGQGEKGWAAVKAAGPADPGFLDGVYSASGFFRALGNELRADAIYTEAEGLCGQPGLRIVRLRLQYMQADALIRNSRFVKAETILRSSLAMENSAAQKSPLYVALLQNLAFVREQEGDLDDAEALYRMTIGAPQSDLSGVAIQTFVFGKLALPLIGEPRTSLAAFYSNHGRLEEAEALYREQLAQGAHTGEERIAAMRQLAGFLAAHRSKTEALAIEEQIVALREAQAPATPKPAEFLENEFYTLANMEVAAGRTEDAKALLERELQQAELQHGKDSAEYRHALNYLFENRRSAGDYDAAEKLAREALRRAEENRASEPVERVSAVFRLSEVRRAQGHVEEADSLQKQGIALNRAAFPQLQAPHAGQFENAEALVRMGKPDEAVRIAREIARSPAGRTIDDQFGFRHLAQSLATEYKAAAAQVASMALSGDERRGWSETPAFINELTDWANFYRGQLGNLDRAGDLLTRAVMIVRACCGVDSPRLETVLQERAWLQAARDGEAAGIPFLEQIRDLRASIYGDNSRQVEQATLDLAEAYARAGGWPSAAKLYLQAVDISTHRTGAFGDEHVRLLDSTAMGFFHHGDKETALELNQRAIERASGLIGPGALKQGLLKHRGEILAGP
ncbi:MAG TPA: tetratricopeptide repeat protein [Bryobacteraceae bacterium]|nr:tetratricopeptide repeat protein [Bryobacteraceae bacterium]